MFRTIFERSNMINNDEAVIYTEEEHLTNPPRYGRLVFSRPVHPMEIEQGLIMRDCYKIGEKPPDITRLLDSAYRMKIIRERCEVFGMDVIKSLAWYISYSYYDCMSGGMDQFDISVAKWAIKLLNVPMDVPLYPGKNGTGLDGWFTIGDFLKDNESVPSLESLLPQNVLPTQLFLEVDKTKKTDTIEYMGDSQFKGGEEHGISFGNLDKIAEVDSYETIDG